MRVHENVKSVTVRCRSCGQRGMTSSAIVGRKKVIDRCGQCIRDGRYPPEQTQVKAPPKRKATAKPLENIPAAIPASNVADPPEPITRPAKTRQPKRSTDRTAQLNIRMSADLRNRIDQIAEAHVMAPSAFGRTAIVHYFQLLELLDRLGYSYGDLMDTLQELEES